MWLAPKKKQEYVCILFKGEECEFGRLSLGIHSLIAYLAYEKKRILAILSREKRTKVIQKYQRTFLSSAALFLFSTFDGSHFLNSKAFALLHLFFGFSCFFGRKDYSRSSFHFDIFFRCFYFDFLAFC